MRIPDSDIPSIALAAAYVINIGFAVRATRISDCENGIFGISLG
jgi:hypothetical protein